ncbi:MAG: HAD family hydrolase [Chloroflexota bacterium]
MKRLFLFDIDGTILNMEPGVARQILTELLGELFGASVRARAIPPFRGMTDLAIIRHISSACGIPHAAVAPRFEEIFARAAEKFREYMSPKFLTLLPGVAKLITELAKRPDVELGLLTGNFRQNAYLKLACFGLDKYFSFGAFGDDHEDRNLLGALAIERGNAIYGQGTFSPDRTYVVGDTERDVACAKSCGAKSIAVATGGVPADVLRESAPDVLLHSFEDVGAALSKIESLIKSH